MDRWLLLLLMIPFGLSAGDTPLERSTLRGLKGVNIVVDPLDQELVQSGLSATAFRIRIEDRLHQADVPVDLNAHEFLGLHVSSVRAKHMPVAMCVSLALYQPVVLSRDNKIRTATGTWNVETVMMSGDKVLQGSANSSVEELVDEFIQAYRAMNPK
jgi:hypothetical protein